MNYRNKGRQSIGSCNKLDGRKWPGSTKRKIGTRSEWDYLFVFWCTNNTITATSQDSPQTVTLAFSSWLRHLLGIHQVSCAPVALYKTPCTSHVHSIPRVSESVVLKPDTWLVPSGLAVALDDNTVESRIAEKCKILVCSAIVMTY